MSRSRIFLLSLLGFLGGVMLRSFIVVPNIILGITVGAGIIFLVLSGVQKKRTFFVYSLLLFAIVLGIYRYQHVELGRPDITSLYQKKLELTGVVVEEPAITATTQKLTLKTDMPQHFRVQVTTRRYPEYALGDEIKIQGVLERPEAFNEVDYPAYLARSDIYSTMVFPKVKKIGGNRGNAFFLGLIKLKHRFELNIEHVLPEPYAAFLEGLLLGERSSLPASLLEAFKVTGTTHIIALSGYNITIVGRFFLTIFIMLSLPFTFSFWATIAGIIIFILMTGASASLVRAGIMGILVLVAEREGRIYNVTNALVFAAAVMVFENPLLLRFDTGFELSFLASIGLLYVAPYLETVLTGIYAKIKLRSGKSLLSNEKTKSSAPAALQKIFIETTAAQLTVLPLLIYRFGRVSLISPFTNILVLVAVPPVMAVGFLAGVAGFLSLTIARFIGWVAWMLLLYMISVIEFFAKFSFASVSMASWTIVPILMLYGLFFWNLKKRRSA